ncbi:unnamed protein product, partial [Iphiclides podalirius]
MLEISSVALSPPRREAWIYLEALAPRRVRQGGACVQFHLKKKYKSPHHNSTRAVTDTIACINHTHTRIAGGHLGCAWAAAAASGTCELFWAAPALLPSTPPHTATASLSAVYVDALFRLFYNGHSDIYYSDTFSLVSFATKSRNAERFRSIGGGIYFNATGESLGEDGVGKLLKGSLRSVVGKSQND